MSSRIHGRRDSDIIWPLLAIAVVLLVLSPRPAQAFQPASDVLLCDPFLTACGDLIKLTAPTITEADWVWEVSNSGPAPMDSDCALSLNSNAHVIVRMTDNGYQYAGPMSQTDACGYVDAPNVKNFIEGEKGYDKALAALKAQQTPVDDAVFIAAN